MPAGVAVHNRARSAFPNALMNQERAVDAAGGLAALGCAAELGHDALRRPARPHGRAWASHRAILLGFSGALRSFRASPSA
jgi:hypothetical protein